MQHHVGGDEVPPATQQLHEELIALQQKVAVLEADKKQLQAANAQHLAGLQKAVKARDQAEVEVCKLKRQLSHATRCAAASKQEVGDVWAALGPVERRICYLQDELSAWEAAVRLSGKRYNLWAMKLVRPCERSSPQIWCSSAVRSSQMLGGGRAAGAAALPHGPWPGPSDVIPCASFMRRSRASALCPLCSICLGAQERGVREGKLAAVAAMLKCRPPIEAPAPLPSIDDVGISLTPKEVLDVEHAEPFWGGGMSTVRFNPRARALVWSARLQMCSTAWYV
jgi:hypothetical protein